MAVRAISVLSAYPHSPSRTPSVSATPAPPPGSSRPHKASRSGRPKGSSISVNICRRSCCRQGVGLDVARLVVAVGVGELVVVGVVVAVGVGEVVGVLVGVGVGEYCPEVGWLWAKLLVAVVGETVGELDLVGRADADAATDGRCEGPVGPRRCPPCEFTASAAEADAATITAAAPATQASRRRLLRCEGPAVPMPMPLPPVALASAAVPGCVGSAGWLGGRGVLTAGLVAAARPGEAYRLITSVSR